MNPADLMTKPLPKPKFEQLMNIMDSEFIIIGEGNMMAFQISVLAVGHVSRTGGIIVPVTNSMNCKLL